MSFSPVPYVIFTLKFVYTRTLNYAGENWAWNMQIKAVFALYIRQVSDKLRERVFINQILCSAA